MKKYIRMQEIMAEPMNLKAYEEKTGNNPLKDSIGDSDYPGYLVLNSAGASRWIKKEIFESQFVQHDSYKDRMEFEASELQERLDNLTEFIKKQEDKQTVNDTTLTLLMMQHNSMVGYSISLLERLRNENKK